MDLEVMYLRSQGLLRLLESEVIIRCREMDRPVVESILPAAAAKYSKILNEEAGLKKTVKLSIDKLGRYLPPPPSGDSSVPSWLVEDAWGLYSDLPLFGGTIGPRVMLAAGRVVGQPD